MGGLNLAEVIPEADKKAILIARGTREYDEQWWGVILG